MWVCACVRVSGGEGFQNLDVVISEGLGEFSAGSEVQQVDLWNRTQGVGQGVQLPLARPLQRSKGKASHPLLLGVIVEVGPVGIRLHEAELKQFSQTQLQDAEADLWTRTGFKGSRDAKMSKHRTPHSPRPSA